jgi:hypothetical protein
VTAGELLATIVEHLDAAGIPHMLAGSMASSFHGEPRSIQDIDLVIGPDPRSLARLSKDLDKERVYVGDAQGALQLRSQFDVIDTTTGWKVDLIIRKDRPFSREEFARRQAVDLLGVTTHVATVEDTVLAKLERARAGGSERQMADVVAVLAVVGASLDDAYLDRWAAVLGISDQLDRARLLAQE